jgi:hypothetical protein
MWNFTTNLVWPHAQAQEQFHIFILSLNVFIYLCLSSFLSFFLFFLAFIDYP